MPVNLCSGCAPQDAALATGLSCFRSQICPAAQLLSCSFRCWPFPWDEVPRENFILLSFIQPHRWHFGAEMENHNAGAQVSAGKRPCMATALRKAWKQFVFWCYPDAPCRGGGKVGPSSFSPAAKIIFLQANRQDTEVTRCRKEH